MLYKKGNKQLFQIHIPRTGGRFTRNIFEENFFDFYFGDYSVKFQGIEIPHLHYPIYNNLEQVEYCPNFCVVRNPFEKFKSTMQLVIKGRKYSDEIYEVMKDKDWLFGFLDCEKNTGLYETNCLRDQSEFISKETKIWKFEDGLGIEYIKWLNNLFDLSLIEKIYDKNYNLGEFEIIKNSQQIDPSVEELIKEYYAKDYESFNY